MMKIILLKDVIGLGEEGDIKEVKDGYALNYLIPYGFAVRATKANLRRLERIKDQIEKRKRERRTKAADIARDLDGMVLTVYEKVAEADKLYGSINVNRIILLLKDEGFNIEKKQIVIKKPIKTLGEHTVLIRFYEDIYANILIKVLPEEERGREESEEVIGETPEA